MHHSNRAVELGMSAETLENILEPDPPGLDAKENLSATMHASQSSGHGASATKSIRI